MITRVKRLLTPPVFEGDANKTSVARYLQATTWLVIVALAGYAVVLPMAVPQHALRVVLILPLLAFQVLVLILLRRGRVRLSVILSLTAFWVILTVNALISGGVRSVAYSGNTLIILTAAILLGWRASVWYVALSIIEGIILVWAELNGFLPPLSTTPPSALLLSIVYFSIGIGMSYFATQNSKAALARANQELMDRQRAESALRLSEAQHRQLIDESPQGILIVEAQGQIALANPAAGDMLGYAVSELLGKDIVSLFDPDELIRQPIPIDDLRAGQTIRQERFLVKKDGSRLPVIGNGKCMPDERLQYTFQSILERKRIEEDLLRYADRLAVLNEVGRAVSTLQDLNSVLELIYRQVQKIASVDAFYISLYDPDSGCVSFPIMYDMGVRYSEPTSLLDQASRLAQVIRTGEPSKLLRSMEELQSLQGPGLGNLQRRSASILLVPLWAAEQVIGALSIQSYTLNAYTDTHVEILAGIAHQAAIAIENARLYSTVQQELLERQRVEAQLRESEERYRLISEVISDYTFSTMIEAQGEMRLDWVAGAFEKITGYAFDEYIARGGWLAALHPDDVEQDAHDMDMLRVNRPAVTEVRTIVKSGEVRWVRVYAHPVWNESKNQLAGIYGAVQDVTERKQAEAASRKSEAILATVAQSAQHLLKSADWRQHIQEVLAQLGEISGASHVYVFENFAGTEGELRMAQRYEWVKAGFRAELDDSALQNAQVVLPELIEWYTPLMRGEPFSGSTQSFPPHWAEDLAVRGIKTLLDVPIFVDAQWWGIIGFDDCVRDLAWSQVEIDALRTAAGILGAAIQRQKADEEREKLIADLEAKNAELERFTYTVSHDLKSPLITIRGFLGFAAQDARTENWERLDEDVARIVEATDKMRRLLDDLLELSRIGRVMNPAEEAPFEAVAREAVELVHGRIAAGGVQVIVAPDLPVVRGDRERLVEVVQNLVDNACKFMGDQAEPQITIGCSGTDRDGKPILFVSDNGVGIEAPYREKVFGLFNKLDPKSEGTGIGLALVKRIVEVHGGRIWVESEGAGKGTIFQFTLPLKL